MEISPSSNRKENTLNFMDHRDITYNIILAHHQKNRTKSSRPKKQNVNQLVLCLINIGY